MTVKLKEAIRLADNGAQILMATADANGLPFLAMGGELALSENEQLVLREWTWPQITVNLHQNPQLAVVVWDDVLERGYQLFGRVIDMEEVGMLNGYVAGEEEQPFRPQVEKEIFVQVQKIVSFSPLQNRPIGLE